MKSLRQILSRFGALVRRDRREREMQEEMCAHLEFQEAANRARGMDAEEARYAALRQFGGVAQVQERCREQRGWVWLDGVWSDLRHAVRHLARSPGLVAVALGSLALGIGANTAVFSALDAILLRVLPVPAPRELRIVEWRGHNVRLNNVQTGAAGLHGVFPYPVFEEFAVRGVDAGIVFAFAGLPQLAVIGPEGATTADALMVSGSFFSGYGASTALGRPLIAADDRPDAAPVAVVSHRWWTQHLRSNPGVLGTSISINRHSFTIVGVLPRDFIAPTIGSRADFFVPMAAQRQLHPRFPLSSPAHWWVQVMARVGSEADVEGLRAALQVVFERTLGAAEQRTRIEQPAIVFLDGCRGLAALRARAVLPLVGLFLLVGIVLLVACANLASLLAARGWARRHESAVRAALGAGRWRLVQQSLVETAVLAAAGGACALLLVVWSRSSLQRLLFQIDGHHQFVLRTDGRVLAFAALATLASAAAAGLLPALRHSLVDSTRDLRHGPGVGGPPERLGRILVSAQIALSTLLVVAAGLFGRSVARLTTNDPGFRLDDLLVFRIDAEKAGRDAAGSQQLLGELRTRFAAIPGVQSVTMSDWALLNGDVCTNDLRIPGREFPPEVPLCAAQLIVGDDFFATMGIPLLLGRAIEGRDDAAGPAVAVVNERFVQVFLEGVHPIGQVFLQAGGGPVEIVGVCRDTAYADVRSAVEPTVFLPMRQQPQGSVHFEIRSPVPGEVLLPAVRRAVAALDPGLPLGFVATQAELYGRSVFFDRLISVFCSGLAVLALGITCLGLYALAACHVAGRTREFGVRVALGATPGRVSGEVLREGLAAAIWGMSAGLPAALLLAWGLRATLFGVSPWDPLTFGAAVILLPGTAVLAGWLPARRAARIDPLVALRAE